MDTLGLLHERYDGSLLIPIPVLTEVRTGHRSSDTLLDRLIKAIGAEDEMYLPLDVVDEHALDAGAGVVRLRWIRDDLWALLLSANNRVAPSAAVLVDLLEHDDPRARRQAARALAR